MPRKKGGGIESDQCVYVHMCVLAIGGFYFRWGFQLSPSTLTK